MNWITHTANAEGLGLPSPHCPDWISLRDLTRLGLSTEAVITALGHGAQLPRSALDPESPAFYPRREALRRLGQTGSTSRTPAPNQRRKRRESAPVRPAEQRAAPRPETILRERHHHLMTLRYGAPGPSGRDHYAGPAVSPDVLRRRGWTGEMMTQLSNHCSEGRMMDIERRVVPMTDLPASPSRQSELRRVLPRTLSMISSGEWLLCDLSGMFYLSEGGMLLSIPYQPTRMIPNRDVIATLLRWATPVRLTDIEADLSAGVYDRKATGVTRTKVAWSTALAAMELAWPVLSPLAQAFRDTHGLTSAASVEVRLNGRSPLMDQARTIAGAPWPYADLSCEVWCSPLRSAPATGAGTVRPQPAASHASQGFHAQG